MEVAGGLAESRVLTSLPEDHPSSNQGLSQNPPFSTGVPCPGLVGTAVLADTWIAGTCHWTCWEMVLGLLEHCIGLSGTEHWDFWDAANPVVCWDTELDLLGCSPRVAKTQHWVCCDMTLGLLGRGAQIVGAPYWACWDAALGLLKHRSRLAGTQHWVCWDTAGAWQCPCSCASGCSPWLGNGHNGWIWPLHPIPEPPTELPPGCSQHPEAPHPPFPL